MSESCCHACAAPIVTNCSKMFELKQHPIVDCDALLPLRRSLVRLVLGFLLNHLPVFLHVTSQLYNLSCGLFIPFAKRAPMFLALCQRVSFLSAQAPSVSCLQEPFYSPRPCSSYLSILARPWRNPFVASPNVYDCLFHIHLHPAILVWLCILLLFLELHRLLLPLTSS